MRKVVALGFALVLAACGSQPQAGGHSGGQKLPNFKMAVMLAGTPDDYAWNYSMYTAAKQVEADRGIKMSISQNTFDPTKSEPVLRQFIDGGYSVIVVDGFNFAPVVGQLAPQHQAQLFSLASWGTPKDNVGLFTYSYVETGYTMCWLGARLSKSHIIGTVGAAPVPFNTEANQGCQAGASASVPGTRVINTYANDFFDQQKASEQAQNVVDQGADVIFVSGGVNSSLGAVAYCRDHPQLICMGANADQSSLDPVNMVSSAVIDWKPFLNGLIDQVSAHKFTAGVYDASFENGGLVVPTFKGQAASRVPAAVQQDFTTMISQLKTGKVTVPASTAHPGYP